jgi:DNA-binding NarL/FixJ family response regulator
VRGRLLVVDDNPGYRRLVRLALDHDPGFEVVAEAATADEALAAAAEASPDVALVDVLLPDGAGFRLPAALRQAVPSCVVVFTSAHPEGDIDAIRELGGIAFLPKSVAPSELGRELAALVAVLDQVQDVLHQAATHLPPSRESPRVARRFVEGILEAWGCAELVDTVTLLVSELVGNAVLHAGSEVELSLRLVGDRLRVDVIDRSTALPRRRDAGEGDQTGRGSDLVEIMASSWGVSGRPDGKSVWFEVELPKAEAS